MKRFYRRPVWAVIALSLVAAIAVAPAASASGEDDEGDGDRTYLVTVENLTAGQPFTPPVAATHSKATRIWHEGDDASAAIQGLAENGNVPGLVAALQNDAEVGSIVVANANGPVRPGDSISFEITAAPGQRRLSIASMLICTNDGFTGLDSLKLPKGYGDQKVTYADGYDAGTELNTEEFDDIVPPCGPLSGVDSMGAGTGATNPALAEDEDIDGHDGIKGGADLDPAIHDWEGAAAKITVTRIDGAAVYEIAISNLTTGQPFTPPVVIAHDDDFELFEVGDEANAAIQGLAENGNVPGVVAATQGAEDVADVIVAGGPVLPGATTVLTLTTDPDADHITIASMLICTNDGFTGLNGEDLPDDVGESVTYQAAGYDAGTELNTEDFDDIVPPCGPLTGVDSMGAGTGMTNPALAENGEISHHAGIAGGVDLLAALHGWYGPAAEVTITRVG